MSEAEMVPVTQAARDAAAAHVEWEHKAQQEWNADWPQFFASDFPASCRKGVWDNHPVVQAFARAMLAAEAAAIEKAAVLVEATHRNSWPALATAIRSLKEGASHVG